jgi:hypothetical protein
MPGRSFFLSLPRNVPMGATGRDERGLDVELEYDAAARSAPRPGAAPF